MNWALSKSTETDTVSAGRRLGRELRLSPERVLVDSGNVIGNINDWDEDLLQLVSFLGLNLSLCQPSGSTIVGALLLDFLLGKSEDQALDVLGEVVC